MINMGTIYMMQLEQTIKCSCTQNRSGGNIVLSIRIKIDVIHKMAKCRKHNGDY